MSIILSEMGADYLTYIPNRLEDGYGLNIRGVALAREKGVKLILTVDCGINSVKEAECANSWGIDIIITDHHEVRGTERPPAFAIVDPHQPECAYPYKYLAGVGVAYKLALALARGREKDTEKFLDLVALGSVADVVPMTGENRILVKEGIKRLKRAERPGLKALMEVAGVEPDKITARHIGFALGPRINATGRVGSADAALELLMCQDSSRAKEIAHSLDAENRNRQEIEKNILKQAVSRVENEINLEKYKTIVLADSQWHSGIIGIVASRLAERFSRPAILIALEGDKGKGSGRSVKGFNLFEAVGKAGEWLSDFGGHEQACGIKIKPENVELFRESLNEVASRYFQNAESVMPELEIDSSMPFAHVGIKLINEISMLMPFGPGNHEPIFSSSGLKVKNAPRSIGRSGFKFLAGCGNITREALTFDTKHLEKPSPGNIINLAYTPSINSWNGIDTIQLNIKDIHIVG